MNLPQVFVDRTQPILKDEMPDFLSALALTVPISVRVNPFKYKSVVNLEPVAWTSMGYYLPKRPLFTLDPMFHAGAYYVQEASSMFLEQAVSQYVKEPSVALDLCAAPGGKTSHLAALLPADSFLVANEYVSSRAHILAENVIKSGYPSALVCNNTPAHLGQFSSIFDLILVDAPCSGEGMFRKDEVAIKEWSLANVEKCVARQESILNDVWPALKEGGILIYSTCTYNREENEERVNWICEELGAEVLPIAISKDWNITETDGGYRFYPHKTKGEGFFMSVLRKTSEEREYKSKNVKSLPKATKEQLEFSKYLVDAERFELIFENNKLIALPTQHVALIATLQSKLNLMHKGIVLMEQKGKTYQPDISLALSTELNRVECATAELDLKTALNYLRTENIHLSDTPLGYVLLTYNDLPLGWVKNLGNRCNALYPSEWRIRMNIPGELGEGVLR